MPPRILTSFTLGALLACFGPAAASPATQDRGGGAETAGPVHQLRVYRLHPGNEKAFHARFRDHALRIMARHGFDVVATWDSPSEEGPAFVYLLEWPDEATMRSRWESFLADEEWKAIKRETAAIHGDFVDGIQERTLNPTDYTPQRRLAD